ncbi:MAG: cation diffusion facilitator family transporter [Propionibacteriaceae bacterium]|nr:cation diffusion facilitator family transporter [Propionibacteriaceae bacterium]
MSHDLPPQRYRPPVDLTRFAWLSIGAALVTIAIKGTAALMTGSVGLLSDAAESLVNLVAAIVALLALHVAIQPPDAGHPFGHSKAEYFSAMVEGAMIFVAAAFIITEAIRRMITPTMPERLGLGLAISVAASFVNLAVALVLLRKGRQEGSATLIADGKHLMTDVMTSAAVLVGVLLVALTHVAVLDPIVALLAGINICWTGFRLIRDSVNNLMDAALPAQELAAIDEILDEYRRKRGAQFHAVRTRVAGNRSFLSLHVLVPGNWTVTQGHNLCEDLTDALVAAMPDLRVTAHLEPSDDPRSYEDIDI